MIRETWSHRYLLWSLVHRQYELRYRQSAVGLAWAVIGPLVTLVTAGVVFHRVAGIDTNGIPYALFVMAGLVPWTFFANSLVFGIPSITQASVMITRLPFPRAVLPLSCIGMSLLDLGISFLIFFAIAVVEGVGLSGAILWLPLLIGIAITLAVGVTLLGAALNVFARDVRIAVPWLVQLWLFLTPVMYPLSAVPPELRAWYALNPMTGIVEAFRDVLILGRSPKAGVLLISTTGALLVACLGAWYFSAIERRFADVV